MAQETESTRVQASTGNVRAVREADTWPATDTPDSADEEPTHPGGRGPILPPRDLPEAPEAIHVLLDSVLRELTQVRHEQRQERQSRAQEHAQSWDLIRALTSAVTALTSEVCLLRSEVASLRSRIDGLACQTPPACPARPELTVVEGGGGE